ncbi:MAG TPA: contractile injection system protein, VgrG/Pvc8 family [Thiobacillus sp.]
MLNTLIPDSITERLFPVLLDDSIRLYVWRGAPGIPEGMLLESWCGMESVCGASAWVVNLISTEANLSTRALLNRRGRFGTRLADGVTAWRSGFIQKAVDLGSDGGVGRYQLVLVPGIWYATQTPRNRIFQNRTLIEILTQVLEPYVGAHVLKWKPANQVEAFLADVPARPMAVQYQESDYTFLTRLLAEEGLGWVMRHNQTASSDEATAGPDAEQPLPELVIFSNAEDFPEDACSKSALGGAGIRWHQGDSQEEQDVLLDWQQGRRIGINQTTTVSWQWQDKRNLTASEPSAFRPEHVPTLESYVNAQDARQTTQGDAARYARLAQEALDLAQWHIHSVGTVRSLQAGSFLNVRNYAEFGEGFTTHLTDHGGGSPAGTTNQNAFNVLSVLHAGINNLPRSNNDTLAAQLNTLTASIANLPQIHAGFPALLGDNSPTRLSRFLPALLQQIKKSGYANAACLAPRALPLRASLPRQAQVAAGFTLPARVVGPHGETTPGNEEIYADAYHRVRVQYFWQKRAAPDKPSADDQHTAWVPVMQRAAGPTRGASFLPRIGQEVLVGFINGQLDQPVVLTSVYNGRGEGSGFSREDRAQQNSEDRAATNSEAAAPDPSASADIFNAAHDSQPAGQGNRAAGQSPAWHGAAGTAHNHAAALLGLRTQEWAGLGHNQLLFDDSDSQLGMQLATTQFSTQFNFGHLRHRADNYRGSLRGQGYEIRTDAYGVVRAKQGLHLTTWGKDLSTPTGDAAATQRLMQIARDTGKNLSSAAATHQTVPLSAAAGVSQRNASSIREAMPPLAAMAHAVSGMVDGADTQQATDDASQQATATGTGKVPHSTDALLTLAGRGGIGLTATEVQMATGETHTTLAGQHHYTGVAGQTRIHSGQAIGLLGGVIQANDGMGLKIVAGNHDIKVQAQADTMQIASQRDMTLTANKDIDCAAAKEITLKTSGGASITIGKGITVQCPGAFTIHASSHQFAGGGGTSYALPLMPKQICISCLLKARASGSAFAIR